MVMEHPEVAACPRCGRAGAMIQEHRNEGECPGTSFAVLIEGEHIHARCRNCGHEWGALPEKVEEKSRTRVA